MASSDKSEVCCDHFGAPAAETTSRCWCSCVTNHQCGKHVLRLMYVHGAELEREIEKMKRDAQAMAKKNQETNVRTLAKSIVSSRLRERGRRTDAFGLAE